MPDKKNTRSLSFFENRRDEIVLTNRDIFWKIFKKSMVTPTTATSSPIHFKKEGENDISGERNKISADIAHPAKIVKIAAPNPDNAIDAI